ncbi:MAG TPA: hypothetical protein VFT22_29665, partial [Kofleriaceae bacterium]|nr:hypothetical protein [Kofleriaceae bacterium]
MLNLASWIVVIAGALVACAGPSASPAQDAGGGDTGGSDPGSDSGGGRDAGDAEPGAFTAGTSTLAGRALPGDVDGARDVARFANPVGVAYRDGRLYVADFDNGKIRVIDTASHETTTLIAQRGFQRPFALAFAGDGTLFVATDNDPAGGHSLMSGSIWRIAPGSRIAMVVAAAIGRPRGLAVLPDGRLAVCDYAHHVIELVDPGSGGVTVLAGAWDQPGFADATGATARFATPYGLALRSDGSLAVADHDNHRIRVVTLAGVTTTLAGGAAPGFQDGAPDRARFAHPQALASSGAGDLFVADADNYRIRRITATSVETVAGSGVAGYRDDDDPLASQLYGLEGIAVGADGAMLYLADGSRGTAQPYNRVRQV